MSNAHIDTDEIVRLYVHEEWSVREIATHFGCSYGRIYGILRARVVMRRSGGKGPRRGVEYIKVAEIMRERIVTGDWRPGQKILAQEELARIFDVRHQTIREAVAHLRQRGYLLTLPNKGTFVRPRRDWERPLIGNRVARTIPIELPGPPQVVARETEPGE
jgi:GntR family transcriptional regulator